MATIEFYSGPSHINNLASSGLGFYGASQFSSVLVSEYQQTTFITNGAGVTSGPQCNNVKYLNTGSGIVNSSTSGISLTAIPNKDATLNIRFSHSSAVKTQNAELRIYDRSNINNGPSGVTCKVAEIIHPDTAQVNNGSGDTSWLTPQGSSIVVSLVGSPGRSGLSPNGIQTQDVYHDFFCVVSASPDSIGSKSLFGAYVSLEYL